MSHLEIFFFTLIQELYQETLYFCNERTKQADIDMRALFEKKNYTNTLGFLCFFFLNFCVEHKADIVGICLK